MVTFIKRTIEVMKMEKSFSKYLVINQSMSDLIRNKLLD